MSLSMLGRTAAPLCLGLLVSACTTVHRPEQTPLPVELPGAFLAVSGQEAFVSDTWWREFDDTQLNRFVERALDHNPGLAQAIARARIAEAQSRGDRADLLPQLSAGLNSSRQRRPGVGIPGGEGEGYSITNSHNATLDVSWEVDLWGRLSSLSAAGQADFLAASEQLRGMHQSLVADVVSLYLDVVQARAQVDLSERTVKALSEFARQVENRVNEGIVSPTDVTLAYANLGSARAGLEQRRENLARVTRQLETLMGDYPAGGLVTTRELPAVPPLPAAGVPAELLARRPDVRSAEWSLLAADYRLGAAERSFLPSLSLTGSTGSTGSELSELFSSGSFIWTIAGNLVQPIFQGGRLRAQADVAEGQLDESFYAYVEVALTALSEVETALAVDNLLAQRVTQTDESAGYAEEAVRVSFNRYRQGIEPFLNVLESQQRALDSRSAYITAQYDRLENRIALHLALGGGFDTVSALDPSVTGTSAL
ncbi:NodT family efflux transporter outer membrane factor (OMF) lipoprotein [Kushneria indalinina DSM 14324]|uniref:NodT family efflux transporter outer membrane factor (OMF) lipoprotein n=2 Tax=Kushneria indalinina TaxID=184067 RepID=A0A3D9DX95_9GAMM|nr:NodT family efflux transporter outer membrane factor (OMF) lipoprotein [Kushneria indalinina DSM 14324]